MKIAPALLKTQFQNQGEAACDVPEMNRCLRVDCVRFSRPSVELQVYIKFILFLVTFATCGEINEIIKVGVFCGVVTDSFK